MNRKPKPSSPASRVRKIDPALPSRDLIDHAVDVVRKGGVIAFPTQCLYGLAANALDPESIAKVFRAKRRPAEKPLLILIRDRSELTRLVKRIPEPAERLMDACWPGSLTLVFEARDHLSEALTAGTGKIGVRIPLHPVARALADAAEFPLTGTSANISDQPGCSRAEDLAPELTERIDLVLDAGPLKGGAGSTVVDVTVTPPVVLREGGVPAERISKILAGT